VDFPCPSNDSAIFRQFIPRCVLTQSEVQKTTCQNTTIYFVQLGYMSPLNMVSSGRPLERQDKYLYIYIYTVVLGIGIEKSMPYV
jgi:hypothetical protein